MTQQQSADTQLPMAISACILAGGQSLRMGQDKGLMAYEHPIHHNTQLMAKHVAIAMNACAQTFINSNQNIPQYQAMGYEVVGDLEIEGIPERSGPLLGLLTGLHHAEHDWVLFSPCDSPLIPEDYASRLAAALQNAEAKHNAYVVHDGKRRQNLHVLLNKCLEASLTEYLMSGQRKAHVWLDSINAQNVDFTDEVQGFKNLNSPKDL